MAKLNSFLNFLGHYKYFITIVLGLLVVVVIGDNSFVRIMKLDMQKSDLKNEIKVYSKQYEKAKTELQTIKSDPDVVERVARERYFMKRDNEDVFVLSTDVEKAEENITEE